MTIDITCGERVDDDSNFILSVYKGKTFVSYDVEVRLSIIVS